MIKFTINAPVWLQMGFAVDRDGIPDDPGSYRLREFWDWRYLHDYHHEWLSVPFSELVSHFESCVTRESRVLILGCGTSSLSADLFEAFGCHITSVDYSSVAIEQMHGKYPHMEWQVMDVRCLQLEDEGFDVVMDKATLDALWPDGESPWNPSESGLMDAKRAISEAYRVLRQGGHFISISLGQPHFRLPHYQKFAPWTLAEASPLGPLSHIYSLAK